MRSQGFAEDHGQSPPEKADSCRPGKSPGRSSYLPSRPESQDTCGVQGYAPRPDSCTCLPEDYGREVRAEAISRARIQELLHPDDYAPGSMGNYLASASNPGCNARFLVGAANGQDLSRWRHLKERLGEIGAFRTIRPAPGEPGASIRAQGER